MRLEKVELRGFKSFYKKVDLHFPSSITAIVGPNGCGKSNIADAINWALGEQSTKRLRVQKMEDLIFNGSENRKPLGMAEVILKMNTADHKDLVITRRLFRLGEAEYQLNGTPCLLRNIQDKLLGSGLGAKSYYFFDHSDIGLVLSPYADDRKKLLEEAAGISKYKLKKRLAENRLAYARQNLLRLNDIIGEVKKQINSLKRQVARGRRYQQLSDELWKMKGAILVKRFHQSTTSREDLLKSVSSIGREIEQTSSRLSFINSQLLKKRQDIQQLEVRVSELRESLHKESLKEAKLGSDTLHYQSEIDNLQAQLQESSSVLSAIGSETKKKDELLTETIHQKSEHQSHLKAEKVRLSSLIKKHDVSKEERKQILATDEDSKKRLYNISSDINRLQSLLNQINENKGRNLSFLKENSSSKNKTDKELRTLRDKKSELRKELDYKEEELQQLRRRLKSTRQTLEETLKEKVREERRLINQEAKIKELSHRLHTLEELEKQEIPPVASHKGSNEEQFVSHLGLVADHINVDPRYEKGVEAFLDTWLSCLVVPDMQTALQGIKYLSSKGLRGGKFLVKGLTLPQNSPPLIFSHPLFSHPGAIAPLSELVSIAEPFKDAIGRLLEQAVMVEDLNAAVELFSKYPEFIFVTLQGEQIYPQGIISRTAKGKGVGLLAVKRVKKRLRTGVEIISQRGELIRERFHSLSHKLKKSSEELPLIQKNAETSEEEVTRLKEELRFVDREDELLQTKRRDLELQGDLLAKESSELDEKERELKERLSQLIAEKGNVEEELKKLQEEKARHQAEHNKLSEAVSRLKLNLVAEEGKLESLERDIVRLGDDIDELKKRTAEEKRRHIVLDERHNRLQQLLSISRQERESLQRSISKLQLTLSKADEKLGRSRILIEAKEQKLKSYQTELEDKREERGKLQVALARAEAELTHLEEDSRQLLQKPLKEVINLFSPEELSQPKEDYQRRSEEITGKLNRLGAVNLAAVEEYQSLEKRYKFLTDQTRDLQESIETLEKAIKKIELTCRRQFWSAFHQVNRNFNEIFKFLFDGGEAELVMQDGGDLWTRGINIRVQPPGKRLQTIRLLSGGERVLTALAFLFALFQYMPSPFCLLDEVDALLDEAKVEKFTQLIKRFQKDTQFLIITHNKLTMQIGDTIHGITMEEPGVSKLVSVQLADMEQE